jgi:outer membrane lipoprotein SlyB
MMIKRIAFPALLGFAVATVAPVASSQAQDNGQQPKPSGGTLKGAAVGAAAGHVMGGHTKTGAAVGAMAGHHERAKSEKQIQNNSQQ